LQEQRLTAEHAAYVRRALARPDYSPAVSIVVDGADGAKWVVRSGRDVVELALEVRDRRFVASIAVDDMPAVLRVMEDLPHPVPGEKVDMSSAFIRVLGHDPFREEPVDRRPWYRKLFGLKG
jgi:hypothetical protein